MSDLADKSSLWSSRAVSATDSVLGKIPLPSPSDFQRYWVEKNKPIVVTGAVDSWMIDEKNERPIDWSLERLQSILGSKMLHNVFVSRTGRYKYFDLKKKKVTMTTPTTLVEDGGDDHDLSNARHAAQISEAKRQAEHDMTRATMTFDEFVNRAQRAKAINLLPATASSSPASSSVPSPLLSFAPVPASSSSILQSAASSTSSSTLASASSLAPPCVEHSTLEEKYPPILSDNEQVYLYGEPLPSELTDQFKPFKLVEDHALTSSLLWVAVSGSVSPLHYDMNEGILVQVAGQKRFILWPPQLYESLYPHNVNHPHDRQSRLNCVHRPDLSLFPDFDKAGGIQGTINAGEFLYIPYGWWHHVS